MPIAPRRAPRGSQLCPSSNRSPGSEGDQSRHFLGSPKLVLLSAGGYSTTPPNRNRRNSLKTNSRRTFYSTISRGLLSLDSSFIQPPASSLQPPPSSSTQVAVCARRNSLKTNIGDHLSPTHNSAASFNAAHLFGGEAFRPSSSLRPCLRASLHQQPYIQIRWDTVPPRLAPKPLKTNNGDTIQVGHSCRRRRAAVQEPRGRTPVNIQSDPIIMTSPDHRTRLLSEPGKDVDRS